MPESQQTKLCKHCKTEIPKDAKVCPNCKKRQTPHGCLIAVVVVIVLIVLLAAIVASLGVAALAAIWGWIL